MRLLEQKMKDVSYTPQKLKLVDALGWWALTFNESNSKSNSKSGSRVWTPPEYHPLLEEQLVVFKYYPHRVFWDWISDKTATTDTCILKSYLPT